MAGQSLDGRSWPKTLGSRLYGSISRTFGIASGIAFTALTALWAEIYGVRHLGAIRSLVVSLSVLSSPLGPLVMGALMDAGVSVEAICGLFALYCVGATGLLMPGLRDLR